MPSLILRLFPVLAVLGLLASPFFSDFRWSDRGDLTAAIEANGMLIDPNGGTPGASPVTIGEPGDPGQ